MYYKLGQLRFITNDGRHCYKLGSFIITNQGKCCYKLGHLLEIRKNLLRKRATITNWGRYYKLGQLSQIVVQKYMWKIQQHKIKKLFLKIKIENFELESPHTHIFNTNWNFVGKRYFCNSLQTFTIQGMLFQWHQCRVIGYFIKFKIWNIFGKLRRWEFSS